MSQGIRNAAIGVLLLSCQGGTSEVLRAKQMNAAGAGNTSTGTAGGTAMGTAGNATTVALPDCAEPFVISGTTTSGCFATVGGFRFKTFPLSEGQPVNRLAVFFHTMGAGDWTDGGIFPEFVAWARARSIVVVAPLADNTRASWGFMLETDADAVGAAIETLRSTFGVTSARTLFWGTFDGSWFMSYAFIRQMAGRLPGTYAMNCDGTGLPVDTYPWGWDYGDSAMRANVSICFNYSSNDVMLPEIQADIDTYTNLGFAVTIRAYTTAGNCSHPVVESTLACWQASM